MEILNFIEKKICILRLNVRIGIYVKRVEKIKSK